MAKRLKMKEKEKRQKLKEASKTGENKKPSKAEVTEKLKKLTKGGKATILKVRVLSAYNHCCIVSQEEAGIKHLCKHFVAV